MKITKEEYKAAHKRIDELLPLVTDDTPDSDHNLIELLKVSDIVEEYEAEIILCQRYNNQMINSVKDSKSVGCLTEFY